MTPAAQGAAIASMMLCGLVMGLAFDVYRVASHRYHVARWLLPALDVAFWAAATLGVFGVLLARNEGDVRMYVFLGLGIGVTGYFGLFSPWVIKAAGKSIDFVNGIARFIWRTFEVLALKPFLWIVRLLAKILDIAFVVTAALVLWTSRLLLKPVAALGRRLWPKTLPIRRKFDPVVRAYGRARDRAKRIRDAFKKKE
ncbi:spore cortex biosynthesis protein YabQ [Cohnella suwonensis]|uniref:Spore cortex biosynthesis protein YabQ n=1 Tax=Cohnella suwonensis TaxID=696072 RepID=A0ABW0LRS9_9BACL